MTRSKYLVDDGLLDVGFQFIPEIDQKYIAQHARWRGIQEFGYTRQEYKHLRNLAKKAHLSKALIEKFDRSYCFTHIHARKLRTGAHNSITGMCYDAAIYGYAEIVRTIEGKTCKELSH